MGYRTIHDVIPLQNKDHDVVNSNCSNDFTWGVICDGVSSSFEPRIGAQSACNTISSFFARYSSNSNLRLDYNDIYSTVTTEINELASKLIHPWEKNVKSLHATTVITAFQREANIEFSYCGNGAILEIRKEWFQLPDDIPTPWGISNYLNPHSKIVDGDNKLFKTIKARQNRNVKFSPDIVSITRNENLDSYFLICSDGLYSSDEISTGWKEDTNDYVLFENQILILFLMVLKAHHNARSFEFESFNETFKRLLVEKKLQTDDISYVLFIPNS